MKKTLLMRIFSLFPLPLPQTKNLPTGRLHAQHIKQCTLPALLQYAVHPLQETIHVLVIGTTWLGFRTAAATRLGHGKATDHWLWFRCRESGPTWPVQRKPQSNELCSQVSVTQYHIFQLILHINCIGLPESLELIRIKKNKAFFPE